MSSIPKTNNVARAVAPLGVVFGIVFGIASAAWFGLLHQFESGALFSEGMLADTRVTGTHFPKQLHDASGRTLTLARPAERVISGSVGHDELAQALLDPTDWLAATPMIDLPAVSHLAGSDRLPHHLLRVPMQVESILALQPDRLLLADYNHPTQVRLLLAAQTPVIRTVSYRSLTDIESHIDLLGRALGVEAQADQLLAAWRLNLHYLRQRLAGRPCPTVLYWSESGGTVGVDTLMDALITTAGGCNVVRQLGLQGHPQLSRELAAQLDPQVILIASSNPVVEPQAQAERLRYFQSHPLWRHSSAVITERLYLMPSRALHATSHHLLSAIWQLAAQLHPGAVDRAQPF